MTTPPATPTPRPIPSPIPPRTSSTGPWDLATLREAPEVAWASAPGPHRSLYYTGEPYLGRPTRVFAHLALPDPFPPGGRPVPAMVLVHGGGGRAFPNWATQWAQRGYAALAMDLSGCGPDGARLPDGGPELSDHAAFHGASSGPRGSWVYHAVAAVVRAVSLLRRLPEVDPERIGLTGISWGGYLACIVAGLDDRLHLAVPVYGCGFLHRASVWKPLIDGLSDGLRAAWIADFEPSRYLPSARLPMFWVSGTNDGAYALDSLRASYRLAPGPRTLRVTINMPHGHAAGWEPLEIAAFADQHCRGGTPLPEVGELEREGSGLRAALCAPLPIRTATLHCSADAIAWDHRRWTSTPAAVGADGIEARLPDERPLIYFLTVTDARGAVVSSDHDHLPLG